MNFFFVRRFADTPHTLFRVALEAPLVPCWWLQAAHRAVMPALESVYVFGTERACASEQGERGRDRGEREFEFREPGKCLIGVSMPQ